MLSVIIPTYNRAQMICDSLDSLLKQNLSTDDYEILVVDNNSKDDTKNVIEHYITAHPNYNIRYIYESRQGDFFARNRGAEEAKGEYLVFTDDDALFDCNYLNTILWLFQTYDVGAVGTKIVIKWEGGMPAHWIKPYEYLLGAISHSVHGYEISTHGIYLNNGSLAIKRDLYISLGGNNPGQIGDYLIGDAEAGLCRKLHKSNIPIAFTDDTTMYHRQIVGKNDTVADIKRRMENNGIADAYTDVFVNNNPKEKPLTKLRMRYYWYKCTLRYRKTLRVFFELCKAKKYNEYIRRFREDKDLIRLLSNTKYEWR